MYDKEVFVGLSYFISLPAYAYLYMIRQIFNLGLRRAYSEIPHELKIVSAIIFFQP